MSKGRITPKQEEILNFIKQHILSKTIRHQSGKSAKRLI